MGKINSHRNKYLPILGIIFLFILLTFPFSIEAQAAENISLTWTGKGTRGDYKNGTYVDEPNLMVDGINSTKWCGVSDSKTLSVSYKSDVPVKVTSYSLTQAGDTSTHTARNWQWWKIYGATSDLDINSDQWQLISQQNSPMTNLTYEYTQNFNVLGNNNFYQYFKVEVGVNELNNGKYRAQMAEFNLYGTKELPTITLGSSALNATNLNKYSYPQAIVTGTVNEVMISVDSGSFTASNSFAVASQDLTGQTKIYNVNNASEAQALLRSCEFTIEQGKTEQKLMISLDGNETDFSSLPSYAIIKMTQHVINGVNHYYAYVQLNSQNSYNNVTNSISFSNAYAEAKKLKYNGLKGYLATITSAEENAILDSITMNMGWGGGGRVSQSDASLNNDTFYKNSSLIPPSGNSKWYWVCGPEAGQEFSYTYWASGEPNGGTSTSSAAEYLLMLHLYSSGKYGWNDVPNDKYKLPGYFVEWSEDTRSEGEPSYYTEVNLTNTLHEHNCNHIVGTSANSNKLYSYCTSDPTCPYYGDENDYSKALSITLNANNQTYVNANNVIGWIAGQTMDFSITGLEQWMSKLGISAVPTIYYKGIGPNTYNSTAKPTAAGSYKACILIDEAEVFIKFEIGYEVSFNSHGGVGQMAKQYISPESSLYELPVCTFKPPMNKEFDGWSASLAGAKIGSSTLNITNNTILYAVWKNHEHRYTTIYFGNGITKKSCDCGFYVIKFND